MSGEDPDDHAHMAAAGARQPCTVLTNDAKDFAPGPLAKRGVRVTDPDSYLCELVEALPDEIIEPWCGSLQRRRDRRRRRWIWRTTSHRPRRSPPALRSTIRVPRSDAKTRSCDSQRGPAFNCSALCFARCSLIRAHASRRSPTGRQLGCPFTPSER